MTNGIYTFMTLLGYFTAYFLTSMIKTVMVLLEPLPPNQSDQVYFYTILLAMSIFLQSEPNKSRTTKHEKRVHGKIRSRVRDSTIVSRRSDIQLVTIAVH